MYGYPVSYTITLTCLPNNRLGPNKRVGRLYRYSNLLSVRIRFPNQKDSVKVKKCCCHKHSANDFCP